MRFRLATVLVSFAPVLVAASQPVRLQPSSPWFVDYAEDSCRLLRKFGEGSTATRLTFESAVPGEWDMLVIGKPLETQEAYVSAKFLPAGSKIYGKVARSVANGDPAIFWPQPSLLSNALIESRELQRFSWSFRPAAIKLAERDAYKRQEQSLAAATTELEIDTWRDHRVILETGSLGEPMAKLDKCGRDSLKDWGLDPDLEDKIVRDVWAKNVSEWLSKKDYPTEMLQRRKESEVAVRLLIDAAGKITKCTSLSHFDEDFNRITCAKITERGRFAPAELADGTKVPSYYIARMQFLIGRE